MTFIGVSITSVWYLDLYRVTLCISSEDKMSRQTTLGRFGFEKSISHRTSVMETKVTDFVSTMSRTIECNHFINCNHKTELYLQMF